MNLLFIFSYTYILNQLLKQKYFNIGGYDERYLNYPTYFNYASSLENLIRINVTESDINLLQSNNKSIDDKLSDTFWKKKIDFTIIHLSF
jgi:hypothetical protein